MLTYLFVPYGKHKPGTLKALLNRRYVYMRQARREEVERYEIMDKLQYANPRGPHKRPSESRSLGEHRDKETTT